MTKMRLKKFAKNLKLWRLGFRSNALDIYRLNSPADLVDYLSFIERERTFKKLNRQVSHVINNKYLFPRILGKHGHLAPENLAVIFGGRVMETNLTGPDVLRQIIDGAGGRIVIKPAESLRARGVKFVSIRDGKICVDGNIQTEKELLGSFNPDEVHIACPHIDHSKEFHKIFPNATTTVRVMTFFDDEQQSAEMVCAIARIGTQASAPFETLILGGLTSEIDLKTGCLGGAIASRRFNGKPLDHVWDTHPDTGAQILGVCIPNWAEIKSDLLDLCNANPFFEMIGWDIIVTNGGFKILEANHRPSQDIVQMHLPMLQNPRLRRFLKRRGIHRR